MQNYIKKHLRAFWHLTKASREAFNRESLAGYSVINNPHVLGPEDGSCTLWAWSPLDYEESLTPLKCTSCLSSRALIAIKEYLPVLMLQFTHFSANTMFWQIILLFPHKCSCHNWFDYKYSRYFSIQHVSTLFHNVVHQTTWRPRKKTEHCDEMLPTQLPGVSNALTAPNNNNRTAVFLVQWQF